MDFSDALTAMKKGKKVRRTIWHTETPWGSSYVKIDVLPEPYEPQAIIYRDGQPPRPFGCTQWDLLAEDWEIVE